MSYCTILKFFFYSALLKSLSIRCSKGNFFFDPTFLQRFYHKVQSLSILQVRFVKCGRFQVCQLVLVMKTWTVISIYGLQITLQVLLKYCIFLWYLPKSGIKSSFLDRCEYWTSLMFTIWWSQNQRKYLKIFISSNGNWLCMSRLFSQLLTSIALNMCLHTILYPPVWYW